MPVELSDHLGRLFHKSFSLKLQFLIVAFMTIGRVDHYLLQCGLTKDQSIFLSTIHIAETTGITVKRRKPNGSQVAKLTTYV